ncbi:hypothetical protein AVEN_258367-1 [Araneus ventricosus]|uniref:Uncharacterized protein n=1 Tax=Araneus ventricosus TaxID=182803 RepID=A0A4Y2QDM2_ARAVE|nr:hypothetical protein AVEN_258367-1 [Araneus ventricosus]
MSYPLAIIFGNRFRRFHHHFCLAFSIYCCGITTFFAKWLTSPLLRRTFFLHVSRSTGPFAQAPFGSVRCPVVPLIGDAIWWVAEPLTVLLCCILQQKIYLQKAKNTN